MRDHKKHLAFDKYWFATCMAQSEYGASRDICKVDPKSHNPSPPNRVGGAWRHEGCSVSGGAQLL